MAEVRRRIKTSFLVTESLQAIEKMVLEVTELPSTIHHRRAYDQFLGGDRVINERLLIKNRKDPMYVHRNALEQTYIFEDQYKEFLRIAHDNNCNKTVVYFQALLEYYSKQFVELGLNLNENIEL